MHQATDGAKTGSTHRGFCATAEGILYDQVHAACVGALKPGGMLILEAYNPQQLEFKTGGPPVAEMMFTKDMLEDDFKGLKVSLSD